MSHRFFSSVSDDELAYVARLDYGQDVDKHLEQLRLVLQGQDGQFVEGQHWYPYEVVELGAHGFQPGHEREFVLCTLLVIAAVKSGFDSWTDLSGKFNDRAADYDLLSEEFRDEIVNAYDAIDC